MNKVKDKKFVLLVFLQLWVITTFMQYCIVMQYQSVLFRDVDQFLPANATCVSSARKTTGTRRHRRVSYTNTYRYEVQGITYTKILSGEKRKGSDRVIYYNPANPEIISYYSNYTDAAMSQSVRIILAVIGQGVIIFFAVRAIRGQKNASLESSGVIIEDDYRFDMNDRENSFPDRMSFTQKEESQEVETIAFPGWNAERDKETIAFSRSDEDQEIETIPFRRSEEKQEVDEIETIAFTRSNSKPAEDFVLYTEDEYKQMQRDN